MTARPFDDTIAAWLQALPPDTLRSLARRISDRTRELGLVVVRPTGDVDIPVTLTPEVVDEKTLQQRGHDAADLLHAIVMTVRRVLSEGSGTPLAKQLFGYFGPLETQCLANWESAEDVTIARVDWFIDEHGAHHALEINATIPAMEAYSDAAARAWIETIGEAAGLEKREIEALVEKNGSNAEELRQTIVAHGGFKRDERPSIAIIHRDADPQLRELQALARHFEAMGHVVALTTPDQISISSRGQALVEGMKTGRPDILYRHIFARRIPEGSVLANIAARLTRARLQNPINGQYEVKGVLAELSRLLEEEPKALALTDEQRSRLRSVIPWTRMMARGTHFAHPEEFVGRQPERFVLKRSWDYGGKSVHLGPDVFAAEGQAGWDKRVAEALSEGDGAFVVQDYVRSPKRRHLIVGHDGETTWETVYVDASTYTATGADRVPIGGVARFARTGIVNIVGGGGVAPLIRSDVAQQLASRLGK